MGAYFLNFIERCRLLIYLVDVGSVLIGESQLVTSTEATSTFTQQLGTLRRELELFNPSLVDASRASIVLGTKIDLLVPPTGGSESLRKISLCLAEAAECTGLKCPQVLLVSALRGDRIEQLVEILCNKILKSE